MMTCDALLPTAERYASLKFRRYAQFISLRLMDWADAIELVAFVESIGGYKFAKWIFHWRGPALVRAYSRLRKHVGDSAHDYIQANISEMGVDQGLAVLRAMQDGGWTRGTLPWCVKASLKELRKRGMTIAEISRGTGLSREQVKTACDARLDRKSERSAAYAALAV